MSLPGPRLPSWAVRQVGSYLGYTGRSADVVARAALDPEQNSTRPHLKRTLPRPRLADGGKPASADANRLIASRRVR